jgi:hypothetical protein
MNVLFIEEAIIKQTTLKALLMKVSVTVSFSGLNFTYCKRGCVLIVYYMFSLDYCLSFEGNLRYGQNM